MTRWRDLTPRARGTVAAAADALALSDELPDPAERREPDAAVAALTPRMAELYAYAAGRADADCRRRVERAARVSGRVSADLARLLARTALDHAPRAAAASAGALDERRGERFVLLVRRSAARPEHAYVVLRLDDPVAWAGSPPAALIVRAGDGALHRRELPAASEGTVQFLEPADGELVAALGDPASEIYLR
jgi:hypothetical protein